MISMGTPTAASRGFASSPMCHPELEDPWRMLRINYDWARNVQYASAMSDEQLEARGPKICRYCRRHWQLWKGSKLDGHAKCYVTDHFKAQLKTFVKMHPQFTYRQIADVLEVTESVIRSWMAPRRM